MYVFLDYDAGELDRQYDVRQWVEDFETHIGNEKSRSAEARAKLSGALDVPYGDGAEERVDIYPAAATNAPVRVFFHGGGWRQNTKENGCFAADLHVEGGALFVAVNFGKIDRLSLDAIIGQSRAAVAWVYRNISGYGGDPERLFVGGISSGAHQAAMVLGTDWSEFDLPADTVKGGVCASGIYDLLPLSFTPRRETLNLDDDMIQRLSPIHNLPETPLNLIAGIAENDSPEFHRQTEAFAGAWQDAEYPCQVIEVAGANHFSNSLAMGDADGPLGQASLAQMGLT